MEFRFRYLGAEREEIEVASVEKLRELVQDGSVGEMTLLFDALTREWAPARAHAIYRFLRDEARPQTGPLPPPTPPSLTDRHRSRARAPESSARADAAAKAASASKPQPAARPDSFGLGLTLSMAEPESDPDADDAV